MLSGSSILLPPLLDPGRHLPYKTEHTPPARRKGATVNAIFDALYRLALALWVGGIPIFTFLVTPILFRSLGRDEAGRMVGLFFPTYFSYNLAVAAAALGAFFLSSRGGWRLAHWGSLVLLVAALVAGTYVRFALYPRAEAVKRTIASFETVPREDPARRQFSRIHGMSMALNMALLADGIVLLLIAPVLRR